MEDKILLESGTNELEVLVFTVGTQNFGINIAKVTEIMKYHKLTSVPDSPACFEGVFTPREKIISIIDLHKVLNREHTTNPEHDLFIICHFNQVDIGFHVTSVKGIQRISWDSIEKPPQISGDGVNNVATGITKIAEDIILILDFEKIVADINPSTSLNTAGVQKNSASKKEMPIVLAEDSQFLRTLVVSALRDAGYTNLTAFADGKEAWDYISSFRDSENILSHVGCLISDIEMPRMDGHHLTKCVKDDSVLRQIPVILFSSLIDEQMRRKGESLGATAQFSKPQIGELINFMNEVI